MADSLKVSPTMIKQPAVGRHQADPQVPFQIKDVTKINNLNTSKQTSSQNQTLLNSDGPKILMDLLRNPESSTHFLHSLYLLQEVSQLIPLENLSLSGELEKIFQSIFLKSDSVLSELLNQSNQSSLFKGELFDWIRDLLKNSPELQNNLVQLLKSMNQLRSKPQYKESLLNQAAYFKNEFKDLKQAESIDRFIEVVNSNDKDLSKELNALFIQLEKSIIYNPNMRRNLGIMQYNLSRYLIEINIDDYLLPLKKQLDLSFLKFESLVKAYIETPIQNFNSSEVIDKITQILEIELKHASVIELSFDKIERIVISLLSSPSNFVPLLHFILPLQGNHLQAYAEVWVDTNTQQSDSSLHILMAVELEQVGHFEIEIFNINNRLKILLFCPSDQLDYYSVLQAKFSKLVLNSSYKLDSVSVKSLSQARSLMEVFEHLSDTQSGLNVYA
jgi:hypothetical protein